MSLTKQEAAQELLNRKLARENLIDFITYTYPNYIAEPAHLYICNVLERWAKGDIKNLILTAPPRFGKSEIVSVRSPAHFLGKYLPTGIPASIILCSYTADLADEKSRECRNLVESDQYKVLFPNMKVADDSRAVNNWEATYVNPTSGVINSAKFIAAGIGGSITGFGAARAIIDDPIKNMEEAMNENLMEKNHTWYKTAFKTRLTGDAGTLIMATRWSTGDLIGRIIKEQTEDWTVVRLPAIAETQEVRDKCNLKYFLPLGLSDPLLRNPGDPLTPKRYSKEWLAAIRRTLGELYFQALYQGAPTLAEGNKFKRDYFKVMERPEKWDVRHTIRVRYWDKAGSDNDGKFTAGVLVAYDFTTQNFIIEDVKLFQYSALAREKAIRETAAEDFDKYGGTVITWVEQEPGSGGKESAETTVVNLVGYSIFVDKVQASKDARLQPYLSQAMGGNIRVINAPWNENFISEHLEIPNGLYRDQSDATAAALNKLILMRAGKTHTSSPIIAQGVKSKAVQIQSNSPIRIVKNGNLIGKLPF